MRCPKCRNARLVQIDITMKGEPVRMHSCSACDTRWWDCDGERIHLDGVLQLATVRR